MSKYLDKIWALIAMANSTTHEAEKESCLSLARKLCTKHGYTFSNFYKGESKKEAKKENRKDITKCRKCDYEFCDWICVNCNNGSMFKPIRNDIDKCKKCKYYQSGNGIGVCGICANNDLFEAKECKRKNECDFYNKLCDLCTSELMFEPKKKTYAPCKRRDECTMYKTSCRYCQDYDEFRQKTGRTMSDDEVLELELFKKRFYTSSNGNLTFWDYPHKIRITIIDSGEEYSFCCNGMWHNGYIDDDDMWKECIRQYKYCLEISNPF